MNHLLDIKHLSLSDIQALLAQAYAFKKGATKRFLSIKLANLFYENSTRTRISFELAAYNLGLAVVNVDLARSSETKGETIEDTLTNLAAMGIDIGVIRHSQAYLPHTLAQTLKTMSIINAGDGQHAHPSQALLDVMTILEHKDQPKKITVVGDLLHSRVARSLHDIFVLMDWTDVHWVAPSAWQLPDISCGQITTSLDEGLTDSEVVICLRVQKERFLAEEALDLDAYQTQFKLTKAKLKQANPAAIVMHPGPVNRGVELDVEVMQSAQSVILKQVTNGVWMRMAILNRCIEILA